MPEIKDEDITPEDLKLIDYIIDLWMKSAFISMDRTPTGDAELDYAICLHWSAASKISYLKPFMDLKGVRPKKLQSGIKCEVDESGVPLNVTICGQTIPLKKKS